MHGQQNIKKWQRYVECFTALVCPLINVLYDACVVTHNCICCKRTAVYYILEMKMLKSGVICSQSFVVLKATARMQ